MTLRQRLDDIMARGVAGAQDIDVLWEALAANGKAEQRAAAEALAALARAGQDVRPLLERGLTDEVARRRWGATYAYALLGPLPRSCLPILEDALGDADGDLRWASATILCAQADLPDVRLALDRLLDSANALQRKMALYCLRDLGVREAGVERRLVSALDDPDVGVRLAAMSALAVLASDRDAVSRALVRRLADPVPGARRAAAAALGRIGASDAATRAALGTARAGDDPALARAAARALAGLDGD